MDKYYVYEGTIIFNCEFDEPLDEYIGIIKNYKKLIFSNYPNYRLCIETNNEYNYEYNYDYNEKYKGSKFNQPVKGALNNLTLLQSITFGNDFNQPVEGALDNLINLQQLTFGNRFNQPVEGALNNLTQLQQLTFGFYFNQELEIPFNIKILKLNCNNKIIDYLPNSIEELYLGCFFGLELNNLPNSIKILSFNKNSDYDKELNNLPKSLEKLLLPKEYCKEIKNINPRCIIIKKIY